MSPGTMPSLGYTCLMTCAPVSAPVAGSTAPMTSSFVTLDGSMTFPLTLMAVAAAPFPPASIVIVRNPVVLSNAAL